MFTTDSRTENFLTSLGVKFNYVNGIMLPGDFVPDWNTDNIGRPVAVREDAVIEYASLMEAGSAAPSPVLGKTEHGFRVLDGVQRLSAAALNETTRVSAYVVRTDSDDLLASIRVLANARLQGRAEPPEWTRRRAVEVLVVERGMSSAEVAQMGGWKPADVKKIAEAIELQTRITHAGGPDLPDTLLAELKPYVKGKLLAQATDPIVGFLHTLKKSRISVSDATPYVASFFAAMPKAADPFKVYTERLKGLHEEAEIRARLLGRQVTELPRDVVLLKALKSAETVAGEILTHGERVPNVDEFFRILNRITDQLKSIAPNKKAKTTQVPSDLWKDKK